MTTPGSGGTGRGAGRLAGDCTAGSGVVGAATSVLWTVGPHIGQLDLETAREAGIYWYSVDADVKVALGPECAAGVEDWHDRFEIAIGAYLGALASDPAVARACLVDTVGAGPRAVDARRHVYSQFAAQMQALRHPRGAKEKEKIPEVQFWAAVGAIGELVQDHILTEGADSLPVLTPTLTRLGWALLETSFADDAMVA